MGFTVKALFGENFEHLERHVEPYRGVTEYRAVEETVYETERVRKWGTWFDYFCQDVETMAGHIEHRETYGYTNAFMDLENWLEEMRGHGIPTMVVDDILCKMDTLKEERKQFRKDRIEAEIHTLKSRERRC